MSSGQPLAALVAAPNLIPKGPLASHHNQRAPPRTLAGSNRGENFTNRDAKRRAHYATIATCERNQASDKSLANCRPPRTGSSPPGGHRASSSRSHLTERVAWRGHLQVATARALRCALKAGESLIVASLLAVLASHCRPPQAKFGAATAGGRPSLRLNRACVRLISSSPFALQVRPACCIQRGYSRLLPAGRPKRADLLRNVPRARRAIKLDGGAAKMRI